MSHTLASDNLLIESPARSVEGVFGLFLFSLVVVSIPIKNFAYVLPPIYVVAQLLWFDTEAAIRTLLVAALVAAVSGVSLFVDAVRGQATNLPGVLVGLVTFLPLFMMVSERFAMPVDGALFHRVHRCVAWFVVLQAGIGAIQLVACGNPDAVTGTLGLLDFRSGAITIMQVYFGFLMLSMVLFLLLDTSTWLAKIAIVAGLVVSAVSQSGHQCIFFIGALGFFAMLQSRRLGTMLGAGAVIAALVVLVLYLYPTTVTNAEQWYHKTVDNPDSPKRMALEGAEAILSDPKNALLGAGVGQFSSRAALITSGELLSVELPSLVVGQSDYYRRYLIPGLDVFESQGEGSAISKPYFSLLSILVEFGPILFGAFLAVFLLNLGRCLWLMYDPAPMVAKTGMLGCVGLTFLLLCCLVENYSEFPQAVFVPYLLFVLGFSRAREEYESGESAVEEAPAP